MSCTALIVAAGKSVRYGGDVPKQFCPVNGRPLLCWTLESFQEAATIDAVVLVVDPEHRATAEHEVCSKISGMKPCTIADGGETRQQSVLNGLRSMNPVPEIVAIHDGARPLVRPQDIDRTVKAARDHGAAILAAPATDTIKRVENGRIIATLDRTRLCLAQTPQVFAYREILEAHESARDSSATDDSSLLEHYGGTVYVVEPTGPNIKVTTPDDVAFVESVLNKESAR